MSTYPHTRAEVATQVQKINEEIEALRTRVVGWSQPVSTGVSEVLRRRLGRFGTVGPITAAQAGRRSERIAGLIEGVGDRLNEAARELDGLVHELDKAGISGSDTWNEADSW